MYVKRRNLVWSRGKGVSGHLLQLFNLVYCDLGYTGLNIPLHFSSLLAIHLHWEPQNSILFENNTGVHTHKEHHVKMEADWSNVFTSQGTQKVAGNHQNLRKDNKRIFPRAFRESMVLLTPQFQTFYLQNYQTINFCYLKPPIDTLLQQPQKTHAKVSSLGVQGLPMESKLRWERYYIVIFIKLYLKNKYFLLFWI